MVSTASGASDQGVWGLYMCIIKAVSMRPSAAVSDFGGRRYHRLFTVAAISARTYVITWDWSHWPLHVGGRGVIETCRLLTAAALSSRSYVIRIVFSLPMSSSLVCWIGPTAVRKKVARVPLGRGLNDAAIKSQSTVKCQKCLVGKWFYFGNITQAYSKIWSTKV